MDDGLSPGPCGERLLPEPPVNGLRPKSRWLISHPWPRWMSSLPFHLLLFLLTILSTLIVGIQVALNYARNLPPLEWDFARAFFLGLAHNPRQILLGLPFSLTLLSILLAHELGHYVACRRHRIRTSYPYFLPAPTLIGTLGAFIRIKCPIVTRRALFDLGISGPLVGFAVTVPALLLAIFHARAVHVSDASGGITLGSPLALVVLGKLLRPDISPAQIVLHPVGYAAWVGLFATGLNLLPVGQLDGGHILYALLGERHRAISRGTFLLLVPLGVFCWLGWILWAGFLLMLGLRHPAGLVSSEPLDHRRKLLAVAAGLVFAFCFVPTPFLIR